MTSSAQLKYLEAIGIPVWVSRELIIEDEILTVSQNVKSINTSQVQASKALPTNSTNSSAQSILNDLENNQSQAKSQTKNQAANLTTKPISAETLAKSVSQSQLSKETTSDKAHINSPNIASVAVEFNNLLYQSSQHYVYASGSLAADWMVIGHSPEPFSGIGQEPFAAEAGELLNNMLKAVGIEQPRSEAYLVNVIDKNLNSQNNHFATDEQSDSHSDLKQQLLASIDKVKPKVLLFVGQIAAQNLLECDDPLIIMRSKVHNITEHKIPCVVTYYPNYLIQKPIDKRKAWDDLKLAMRQLN